MSKLKNISIFGQEKKNKPTLINFNGARPDYYSIIAYYIGNFLSHPLAKRHESYTGCCL